MNNSKAGCFQSKKKLQMNKDLLKIRFLYNFDCICHPFPLSIQIQSVIKSLNEKKHEKLVFSKFDKNTIMLWSILLSFNLNRPQESVWLENRFVNTAKCWQTFYGFLQIYHSYYNKQLRADTLVSFTLACKSFAVFVY